MTAIDIKSVKKVKNYREKGLSFREISKILGADVRQVHRWYTYQTDKEKIMRKYQLTEK
jgi:hypothetical protein